MLKNKKAEMGMGTLIIFIAMVLVAAIAAAVLISTTGSLQNKALATGKDVRQEVGTSLNIIQVYAEDGSDQYIEEFYQSMKLNSGSDPLRFADLLLSMNLNNQTQDYKYDSNIDCTNTSSTNTTNYGVVYSIEGTNYKSGYLTKGDVAKLCFEAPRAISEGESVELIMVPKIGTPRVVEAYSPGLMVNKRVEIFP